jgi:ABC-type multidrug transport system permease subunit
MNFRSPQALVYGYLVPLFFLIAFGSIFKTVPPLYQEMGQLLTITTLGGACFGMPTAMVAERERGVWRRYRLLPASTIGFIFSTMLARFALVVSAALMQIGLAKLIYGTWTSQYPLLHPFQLFVAFGFVCFAFLSMGLVIAMLADNVPAVQALGQAIFLPMIIIGGVGVPLKALPVWAQHFAGFLPGRYAVDALQACINGNGLSAVRLDLAALLLIGLAALLAGAKLFRWDVGQRLAAGARAWTLVAIVAWLAVGLIAESRGTLGVKSEPAGSRIMEAIVQPTSTTAPTTANAQVAFPPTTQIAATQPATAPTAPNPPNWQAVTGADADQITYDDLEADDSTVTPIGRSLDGLPEDVKGQMDDLAGKLGDWAPGHVDDPVERVRNLLSVCAVPDVLEDPNESNVPLVVFEQIKASMPKEQLIKVLTWIALKPDEGTYLTALPELGFPGPLQQDIVRERAEAYGRKLLARVLGKYHPTTAP